MKKLKLEAIISNIAPVTDWVNEELDLHDCPVKLQLQIDIAIDEIITNIASYAYGSGSGDFTVEADVQEEPRLIRLRFSDSGIPFDPLQKADPDTSLSAEDRQIGGLGIYLVKKTMDEVRYEYSDNQNILTVVKYF
jgi:anti-sigma regulatory factor (Ser/Thr protein kinase)